MKSQSSLTLVLVMEGFDRREIYFFRSFYFPNSSLEMSFPIDGSQTRREKVNDVKR